MIKLATAQLWVHDQDEAVDFYTRMLGMEVRQDVTLAEMGNFRWLTVGPREQFCGRRAAGGARHSLCFCLRIRLRDRAYRRVCAKAEIAEALHHGRASGGAEASDGRPRGALKAMFP